MPKGNGDPRLCIFGRKVAPNQHKIADEFVLLDDLYCDGEAPVHGHSWSNSAYATDFNERKRPPRCGGRSASVSGPGDTPSSGHLWDLAARKASPTVPTASTPRASAKARRWNRPGIAGMSGHVSPKFRLPGMRDAANVRYFSGNSRNYEKNFDAADANKRAPNCIVMSLGENHTRGKAVGAHPPTACVANNDWAVGQLAGRVSHSRRCWPETAIFIIEDEAQNGPDGVDTRRTAGLVIRPYTRRRVTVEQVPPQADVNARNTAQAWGARESLAMDFSDYDRTPESELNEIIWKSVRGADSEMPLLARPFHFR